MLDKQAFDPPQVPWTDEEELAVRKELDGIKAAFADHHGVLSLKFTPSPGLSEDIKAEVKRRIEDAGWTMEPSLHARATGFTVTRPPRAPARQGGLTTDEFKRLGRL